MKFWFSIIFTLSLGLAGCVSVAKSKKSSVNDTQVDHIAGFEIYQSLLKEGLNETKNKILANLDTTTINNGSFAAAFEMLLISHQWQEAALLLNRFTKELVNAKTFAKYTYWLNEAANKIVVEIPQEKLSFKDQIVVLAKLERFKEGVSLCKNSLADNNLRNEALNYLSYFLFKLGELNEAVFAANLALKENEQANIPSLVLTLNKLFMGGESQQVLNELKELYQKEDAPYESFFYLAWLYSAFGSQVQAQEVLRLGFLSYPLESANYLLSSIVYASTNDDISHDEYKKIYLELSQASKIADEELAKLKKLIF